MVNLHLAVTMRILVIAGFLSSFAITGLSLICITCRGKYDCTGPAENCSSPEDVCLGIAVQMEFNRSRKSHIFLRQCGDPKYCNQLANISTFNSTFEFSTKCCQEDSCIPERPLFSIEEMVYQLPPEDERLFCPTCDSRAENNCTAKYAFECSAFQSQCIIRSETSETGSLVMTGCATENFCAFSDLVQLLEGSEININCTEATNNASLPINYFRRCNIYTWVDLELVVENLAGLMCSMDQDACLLEYNVIKFDEKETTELMVKCGKSSECNRTGIIRNADKTIRFNSRCCFSDSCIVSNARELFEINTTIKNDLQCSSCFSPRSSEKCLTHNKMKCIGDENSCISYKAAITEGQNTTYETLYGCGTESICKSGNRSSDYGTKKVEMSFTCHERSSSERSSPVGILLSYIMFIYVFKAGEY